MSTFPAKDTAPSHRWLRLLLALVAALEFLDALSGVQNIFIDYHTTRRCCVLRKR